MQVGQFLTFTRFLGYAVQGLPSDAVLTPRMIQAKVYDDAIKPGIETRAAIKLVDIRKRP